MNTCPNCGKVAGLHSSILQGCMCQYSMQEPPQRTWVNLTVDELIDLEHKHLRHKDLARAIEAKLKEKNT